MIILCICWTIAAVLAIVLIHRAKPLPEPEPLPDRDSVERRDEMRLRAAWHREQLEGLAEEFVGWHGFVYRDDSIESDELEAVILDGADYVRVIKLIADR